MSGRTSTTLNLGRNCDPKQEMGSDLDMKDRLRFAEFLRGIHHIGRLRRDVANVQVDARQKMREVGFKRQSVWFCDAAFMREVQKITVEGSLDRYAELRGLAAKCQAARDGLGPLEQEGIEAEQLWEGHNWTLMQAEEGLYNEFKDDFSLANAHHEPPFSEMSSQYDSYSGSENNHDESDFEQEEDLAFHSLSSRASFSNLQDVKLKGRHHTSEIGTSQLLLGLASIPPSEDDNLGSDLDSGIEELDCAPGTLNRSEQKETSRNISSHYGAVTERYPELSLNFRTRRNRIDKWLLQTMLLSHLEADLLVSQLGRENEAQPSNWSQLVIAYWESDGAAILKHQQTSTSQEKCLPETKDRDVAKHERRSIIASKSSTSNEFVPLPRQLSCPGGREHSKSAQGVSPISRPRAGIGWDTRTV